jgi:hypothetical protein
VGVAALAAPLRAPGRVAILHLTISDYGAGLNSVGLELDKVVDIVVQVEICLGIVAAVTVHLIECLICAKV